MKAKSRKVVLTALALLVLGAGAAGAAQDRIDLEDRGWVGGQRRVSRPGSAAETGDEMRDREQAGFLYFRANELKSFNPTTGSLEINVRRLPGKEPNYYPLVEFIGRDGEVLLSVMAHWVDGLNLKGKSVLYFHADDFERGGVRVWGQRVQLPRRVAEGERVRIHLTWGQEPKDNRVYLDGEEASHYGAPLPKAGTRPTAARAGKMKAVLAGTRWIRIPEEQAVEKAPGEFFQFDKDSAVKTVIFYDEIVSPRLAKGQLEVAAVTHNAARVAGFSGKLVVGDRLGVALRGTPGASASFDVAHFPDLEGKIALDWRGWGVYLEEKRIFEEGEVDLREVSEYRVFAGKDPIVLGAAGLEPVAVLKVGEQSYTLERLDPDTPYYFAVAAAMRDGTLRTVLASPSAQPLAEREDEPGLYTGGWKPGYQDRLPRAVVVGRLAREETAASGVSEARTAFAVEPALTIAVATEPKVLKADEKSTAKVDVTVTDANGNPVAGHKVKFLLATTSQYTGVVGGGAFADQVGGTIADERWGETDLFGKLSATYVAGFAAKTAVIVVRDMLSDDTGAGYVKTFIQGTAQLELEPTDLTAALEAGYEITVTSSDDWLTADGKSQARITAKVTLAGKPVEGHDVTFQVSSGTGQIRVVSGTTDRDGEARAVYTAGKKIGIVLITATDRTVDLSGSVQIELRSDAPAKLAIKISPEKLPADGSSTADLSVLVTDINDNPNDNVEVLYAITEGGGRLREEKTVTDRDGETENRYTAGRTPGRVTIEMTVSSTVPTDEELVKARDLALAVTDYRFF